MSQPWSKLRDVLAGLGRIRLPLWSSRTIVEVGDRRAADATGGTEWTRFHSAEALFDAWSPPPESPWEPFHCVTLFAALDRISRTAVGSAPKKWFTGRVARPFPAPAWVDRSVWAFLDLPGSQSVAAAAWLSAAASYQTVCTFDNWPHPQGLMHPERVLAALLRYAPIVAAARGRLQAASPPAWVCDRDRLGTRSGRPNEFDNRYFLDDSILPGPELLRAAGIGTLVYVAEHPSQEETADLSAYFRLLEQRGFQLLRAGIDDDATWQHPQPFRPLQKPFRQTGFMRSSAGGFGAPIPEPSSSSG